MATNDKNEREARRRLRAYQARQQVHQTRLTRRKRDNMIAIIVGVVVIALAVGAQLAFFYGGPGTPEATPSATPTDAPSDAPTETPAAGENSGDVPPASLAEDRTWTGTLTVNDIPLGIELDGAAAPQGVSSTIALAQSGFYDGLSCHRLTTEGIFVLQCGDPVGDGTGGPGYSYGPVENAPADNLYPAGTLAMARQGGNGFSMGSQFFILYEDSTIPSDAGGGYTVLGTVTSGLDQLISQVTSKGLAENGVAPLVPTTITGITLQ